LRGRVCIHANISYAPWSNTKRSMIVEFALEVPYVCTRSRLRFPNGTHPLQMCIPPWYRFQSPPRHACRGDQIGVCFFRELNVHYSCVPSDEISFLASSMGSCRTTRNASVLCIPLYFPSIKSGKKTQCMNSRYQSW